MEQWARINGTIGHFLSIMWKSLACVETKIGPGLVVYSILTQRSLLAFIQLFLMPSPRIASQLISAWHWNLLTFFLNHEVLQGFFHLSYNYGIHYHMPSWQHGKLHTGAWLPAHNGNSCSCKFLVLYLEVWVTSKALLDFRCMLFVCAV